LGEALGDLPLALVQAAGVMAATGMPTEEYLAVLAATAAKLLEVDPPGYAGSLAASVRIATDQLTDEDVGAGQLVRLCAMLGPEPIPVWLFSTAARALPAPLSAAAADTFELRQCIGRLGRYGLVQVGAETLAMHRLTQAIIRDNLRPPADRLSVRGWAEAALIAAQPDDGNNPSLWPRWGQLLPHILAVDPGTSTAHDMMEVAVSAVWHLYSRGDYATALPVAHRLHEHWQRTYGRDNHFVLVAAHNLAAVYRGLGRSKQARQLHEDIWHRTRRAWGDDHPYTLAAANNLALDLRELGEVDQARQLDQDTLGRFRRVLGDDHPNTLASANNLAIDMRRLGEYEQARQLNEDTLTRRRRLLGDDHPHTLTSADSLAFDMRWLGEFEHARRLDEETYSRRRRVLGDDHPNTLDSATSLAVDMRRLGDVEQALRLDEDTYSRRRRVLGESHPDTRHSLRNLAEDLRALGGTEQ
jgi:hypothetical protein